MDSSPSSEGTVTADLGALLESTMTLSRGLETLYSEHEVLLEALGASGETSKTSLDSSQGIIIRDFKAIATRLAILH